MAKSGASKGAKNTKSFDEQKTKNAAGQNVARYKDPRSRPGLYYGSDGLRKIKLPNGEIRWVESDVHSTRT